MENKTDLDLILIGKTGNGKSTTGNSIIRRQCFKSSYTTTSITKYPQYEVTDFEGLKIQVVDCPGVLDTDIDQSGGVDIAKSALQNALLINPQGYHAFLIVVKFAQRFTKQEQDSIKILKDILGKDVIKNHGIVVLTNGDTFEYYCAEHGLTLEQFCKAERGPFKELLNECDNRIVVFNNITKDEHIKTKQIRGLILIIGKLQNKDSRYTNEHFVQAEFIHTSVKQKHKPMLDKKMLISQSLTLLKLKELKTFKVMEEKIKQLSLLKKSSTELLKCIEENESKEGMLLNFFDNVKRTQEYIERKIELLHMENLEIQGDTIKFNLVSKRKNSSAALIPGNKSKEVIKTEELTTQNEEHIKQKAVETLFQVSSASAQNKADLEDFEIEQLENEFLKIKREADDSVFSKCINYIKEHSSILFDTVNVFLRGDTEDKTKLILPQVKRN